MTNTLAIMLAALSTLESGNNDQAKGIAGERGRHQITPAAWRETTTIPFSQATNAAIEAQIVLERIRRVTHRDPASLSPAEFARAWHFPYGNHLNRERKDYIRRYQNIAAAQAKEKR